MKSSDNNKYIKWGLTAFLVVAASLITAYIVFNFSNFSGLLSSLKRILSPIIDGIALAYILTPILNFVESKWIGYFYRKSGKELTPKRKKARRNWSILVTMVLVVTVVVVFFRLVIPQLILSIQSIIFQFPIYVSNLGTFVSDLLKNNPDLEQTVDGIYEMYSEQILDFFQNNIIPQANQLLMTLTSGVISILRETFNFIVGIIISVYLMASKETLAAQAKKFVYSRHDTKSGNRMISGIRYTHKTFIGFLGGKIIDSIIIGILTFIVINIADIPYAVLVSVIVGVTNVIPFFGPYIGAIPSTLLVLMVDPIKALYFVIIILIIQQIDGNIIGPKILGDSTGLSSFWVIFSITLFGGLFGVAGMILGVPVFAVFYAWFIYKINHRLKNKNLPTDEEMYVDLGSIEKDGTFIEYVPIKGRSLLQILGIKKTDVVKREIVSEEDEPDDSDENNIILESTAHMNIVDEEALEHLEENNDGSSGPLSRILEKIHPDSGNNTPDKDDDNK